jgi:hypothetical protein
MRGFAAGLVAGALIMAATKLFALPAMFDDAAAPQAGTGQGAVMQWVDRTDKGDRLDAADHLLPQPSPARKPERILTGCEPVISPLSVSARATNFPRRCVASRDGLSAAG